MKLMKPGEDLSPDLLLFMGQLESLLHSKGPQKVSFFGEDDGSLRRKVVGQVLEVVFYIVLNIIHKEYLEIEVA